MENPIFEKLISQFSLNKTLLQFDLKYLPHFIFGQLILIAFLILFSKLYSRTRKRKQVRHICACIKYLETMLEKMNGTVRILEAKYDQRRLYCSNGTWERLNELRTYRDAINSRLNDLDFEASRLKVSELSSVFSNLMAAPLNIRVNSNERLIADFPYPSITINQADKRFEVLAEEISKKLSSAVPSKQAVSLHIYPFVTPPIVHKANSLLTHKKVTLS